MRATEAGPFGVASSSTRLQGVAAADRLRAGLRALGCSRGQSEV